MKKFVSLLLILFFCANPLALADYLVKKELAKDIYKVKDSSKRKPLCVGETGNTADKRGTLPFDGERS